MVYAERTKVSINQTKADIEALVARYGADSFGTFNSKDKAIVVFEHQHKRIVIHLPLPSRDEISEAVWKQQCRSRWRALLLTIKAKLESIEAGIETFEEAFLAHIMTPDGRRFADVAIPQIESAYSKGEPLPPLLPAP